LTYIECEECNAKFISSTYEASNAYDMCECGNLEIAHLESAPPTRLKGYVTVKYIDSYPNIYEVIEKDRPVPEKKEEQKSIGFS